MIFVPFARLVGPTARPPNLACPSQGVAGPRKTATGGGFHRRLLYGGKKAFHSALPHPQRRWQVWYLVGHFAPLCSCTQDPRDSVEHRSRVLPRTTKTVNPSLGS